MPEEMNTTNGGGGTSEQVPEQMPEAKQGRSGKIIAVVLAVLIIAGAVYAWSRRVPQGEQTTGGAEQGTEQGAQIGQPAPGEGNVPETEVGTSTADATGTTGQADANTTAGETTAPAETPAESTAIITHTDSGYSPKTLTIKKGSTPTFKNESDNQTWPASATHPTHTVYPGSSIDKCGTAEQSKIFDACGALDKGESWSFKFDNVGSWKYHDHLEPGHNGTIVVTE